MDLSLPMLNLPQYVEFADLCKYRTGLLRKVVARVDAVVIDSFAPISPFR